MSEQPLQPNPIGAVCVHTHPPVRHKRHWSVGKTTLLSMGMVVGVIAGYFGSGVTIKIEPAPSASKPKSGNESAITARAPEAERRPAPRVLELKSQASQSTASQSPASQSQAVSLAPTPASQSPLVSKATSEPRSLTLSTDEEHGANGQSTTDNPFQSDLPIHAHNVVDDLVFMKLIALGIKPAKLCSDEVFLRRVYIDAIGTLPTLEETKQFLGDHDSSKREKLVEQVLQRSEFADYWAMKWCDILRVKSEFPINLWPNAAQAYHRWIRTSIRDNVPYDAFARELLTASGSNFRKPQVNFYRATQSKEPQAIAQAVALTFMGERADKWPADRLLGMSVFFSQVGRKPTGEWKEEIIFFDRHGTKAADPNTPMVATFPNGTTVEIPVGQDPRYVFADWLVSKKNPWFARVLVNRIWQWLMGRGIVEPPDDVRPDNPASNKELLNGLANELVEADFDVKRIYRLIFNSNAYQLSCIPQSEDSRASEYFAYYPPRRLDAEVLIDAICQLTGTTESYSSITPEPFTFLPDGTRAISLPDGSITSSFLEMFGRPPRDTGMVSERNNRLTAGQALHLINSNHILHKLKQGWGMQVLLSGAVNSTETAERLYLAILSRHPTEQELQIADSVCQADDGAIDLAWALINSDEFLFQH